MWMPNKQKMQNYDYFDILYFKDRSDRDRIAIRSQDRDRFFPDRDLGVGLEKFWIANSNTFMNVHERSWTFMDVHGRSWTFMDVHGRFSDAGRKSIP
jgi:hypothetical protein